jgi:hypothetical protein
MSEERNEAEWLKRREAFAAALTKLSMKHGIIVGGCGCCGSPFLTEATDEERSGRYVVSDDGMDPEIDWKIP